LLIGFPKVIGWKVDKNPCGAQQKYQKAKKMLTLIGRKTGFVRLFGVIESHGGNL
jgi:hypothetical protein